MIGSPLASSAARRCAVASGASSAARRCALATHPTSGGAASVPPARSHLAALRVELS